MTANDDILATIGLIVIESQTVETLLTIILVYVLQDGTPLTYQRIQHIDMMNWRTTLGGLLRNMKDRADYTPQREVMFDRILEHRNILIHRFREVEGSALESEANRVAVAAFLHQLQEDTMKLMTFFAAWVLAWQEQTGIGKGSLDSAAPPELVEFLAEIRFSSLFVGDHVHPKERAGQ